MMNITSQELYDFVVRAKANSYVGGGKKSLSYRPGSHDIQYHEDKFSYIDSYFGGNDFLGQEVVYYTGKPVWAMNYYGKILRVDLYNGALAGQTIMESLSKLYQTGHFLGNSEHETPHGRYFDTNEGNVSSFTGYEWIEYMGEKVYDLRYHGGLIKD